jgi:hypothetical protein
LFGGKIMVSVISSKLWSMLSVILIIVIVNIAALRLMLGDADYASKSVMGGELYFSSFDDLSPGDGDGIMPDEQYIERFLRPSDTEPLERKFYYNSEGKGIPEAFSLPSDCIRAYYDILSSASNMGDKRGGCGSIGFEKTPYTAAYKILSSRFKKDMPYEQFLKSFEGIGHISLLKLVEVSASKSGEKIHPGFFVEIETIEGSDESGKTCFAYYYGFVIVEQEGVSGWKISSIRMTPEDFLCHAYHGWWHDAGAVVENIYIKKCGAIDKILGVEEDGHFRNVLAKGRDGRQYRFMFIRLTNGADIELRQFVLDDGKWKDVFIDPNNSGGSPPL